MKKTLAGFMVVMVAGLVRGDGEPWQDPAVNRVGCLAARADFTVAPTAQLAADIAALKQDRFASPWMMRLSGDWQFDWKRRPDQAWEVTNATVTVPGCWQVPGNVKNTGGVKLDPPIYTNIKFPHTLNYPRVMDAPADKHWTSFDFRNPVGRYRRAFTMPSDWTGRRLILHFDGVASAMFVRVNGTEVGYSEDSRLPAEFDITDQVRAGENSLEVEVLRWCDGSFLENQDFWRLSGIYREVWLSAERGDGLRDLRLDATLDESFRDGLLSVKATGATGDGIAAQLRLDDPDGRTVWRGACGADGRCEARIAAVQAWNGEQPRLYTLLVETGGDWTAFRVGFRSVAIEDGVLKLNGRRILVRGVNRHEMNLRTGYTVTRADMEKAIEQMKDLNINAVRTSHYPCASDWYKLCDEQGIYVLSEANVESHELGRQIAKEPTYRQMHVERCVNMINRLSNHASIIFWSVGNEADAGPNTIAAWEAMKKADPVRPVQYEPHSEHGWRETDIYATGYHHPDHLAQYAARKPRPTKPYIAHEYAHAMGNANGDVHAYWRQYKTVDILQGGFIWDFQDQALLGEDGNLKYGGDFGDRPNDGNFNCNGLYDAEGNLHPGAYELKHAMQPIDVLSFNFETREAVIRNTFSFRSLSGIRGVWVLTLDNIPLTRGTVDVSSLAPGATETVVLEDLKPKNPSLKHEWHIVFKFFEDEREIASDQLFVCGRRYEEIDEEMPTCTGVFTTNDFTVTTWRALTDSDRGAGFGHKLRCWRDGEKRPDGTTSHLTVTPNSNGTYRVKLVLETPAGAPMLPRVGLSFKLPKTLAFVGWCGRGPFENYDDRQEAAFFGVYGMPVEELNNSHYIRPGECGHRGDVRCLYLTSKDPAKYEPEEMEWVYIRVVGANFGFNVFPWSQTKLEAARHQEELVPDDELTVIIDAAQMGIGGDHSWGAWPHKPYLLESGKTYTLEFDIGASGFNDSAETQR